MAKKKWWEYSTTDNLKKKRIILLFEEINNKTAKDVVLEMIAMSEANLELPIWLYINSVGGYVPAGLAIIDIMKLIEAPVYTVIVGEACSMGSVISVCGDKRFITENSYFMGHPMSFGVQDYTPYVKDRFSYCIDLEEKLISIYKRHTKLTKKDIEKMRNGELWLDAKACLRKGIVDEVL